MHKSLAQLCRNSAIPCHVYYEILLRRVNVPAQVSPSHMLLLHTTCGQAAENFTWQTQSWPCPCGRKKSPWAPSKTGRMGPLLRVSALVSKSSWQRREQGQPLWSLCWAFIRQVWSSPWALPSTSVGAHSFSPATLFECLKQQMKGVTKHFQILWGKRCNICVPFKLKRTLGNFGLTQQS